MIIPIFNIISDMCTNFNITLPVVHVIISPPSIANLGSIK